MIEKSDWMGWSDRFLRLALLFLLLGTILGKLLIGVGQGFLAAGLSCRLMSGGLSSPTLGNLRGSTLFLFGFTFLAVVSVLANLDTIEDPIANLKRLRYLVVGFILLFLPEIFNILNEQRFRDVLVKAALGSILISVVFGFLNLWFDLPLTKTKDDVPADRLNGIDGEIISFAVNLQFFLISLVVFHWRRDLFRHLTTVSPRWLFLVIPTISLAIYFSYSRGAVLGLVVGLLVFGLIQSRVVVGITVAVGIALGLFAYYSDARYFTFEDELRISNWKTSAMTTIKYPLVGVGFRNYEMRSLELKEEFGTQPYRDVPEEDRLEDALAHSHNNYLEAFSSTGVFGGLAFLGFCLCWLSESYRSIRYRALLVPMIASFLTIGLFDCTFFDGEIVNTILLLYVFSQFLLNKEDIGVT